MNREHREIDSDALPQQQSLHERVKTDPRSVNRMYLFSVSMFWMFQENILTKTIGMKCIRL